MAEKSERITVSCLLRGPPVRTMGRYIGRVEVSLIGCPRFVVPAHQIGAFPMRWFRAVPCLVILFATASNTSAAVLISSGETQADVFTLNDGGVEPHIIDNQGMTATATLPGGNSSVTTSVLTTSGDSANFSVTVNQSRDGIGSSYADGALLVYFSTDVDVSYTASGNYSNSNGFGFLQNYLWDYGTNFLLYDSEQINDGTPVSFLLGGLVGNYSSAASLLKIGV